MLQNLISTLPDPNTEAEELKHKAYCYVLPKEANQGPQCGPRLWERVKTLHPTAAWLGRLLGRREPANNQLRRIVRSPPSCSYSSSRSRVPRLQDRAHCDHLVHPQLQLMTVTISLERHTSRASPSLSRCTHCLSTLFLSSSLHGGGMTMCWPTGLLAQLHARCGHRSGSATTLSVAPSLFVSLQRGKRAVMGTGPWRRRYPHVRKLWRWERQDTWI